MLQLPELQQINDLETGNMGAQVPTATNDDDITETFLNVKREKTIVLSEDDYGDETSQLLEENQINSR
jgi:hypothetical protein